MTDLDVKSFDQYYAHGWRKIVGTTMVHTTRPGFAGVLDAISAWLWGANPHRVQTRFRIEVIAQLPEGAPVKLYGATLTSEDPDDESPRY